MDVINERIGDGPPTVPVAAPAPLDAEEARSVAERAVLAAAAMSGLGVALARVGTLPGPETLQAARDREVAWREMEQRWGLLSAEDVADLAGSQGASRRQYASGLARRGRLLGVRRTNRVVYPGFQFGPGGRAWPGLASVLDVFGEAGWSSESVALWFTSPQGFLDDRTPADGFPTDPDAVLAAADGVTGEP